MLRDAWYARRSDASGVEAGSLGMIELGLAYQNGVGTKASGNLARHCMPSDAPWLPCVCGICTSGGGIAALFRALSGNLAHPEFDDGPGALRLRDF